MDTLFMRRSKSDAIDVTAVWFTKNFTARKGNVLEKGASFLERLLMM